MIYHHIHINHPNLHPHPIHYHIMTTTHVTLLPYHPYDNTAPHHTIPLHTNANHVPTTTPSYIQRMVQTYKRSHSYSCAHTYARTCHSQHSTTTYAFSYIHRRAHTRNNPYTHARARFYGCIFSHTLTYKYVCFLWTPYTFITSLPIKISFQTTF